MEPLDDMMHGVIDLVDYPVMLTDATIPMVPRPVVQKWVSQRPPPFAVELAPWADEIIQEHQVLN